MCFFQTNMVFMRYFDTLHLSTFLHIIYFEFSKKTVTFAEEKAENISVLLVYFSVFSFYL